jgi:lipopolysaccharide/colanic/teichoic acid biosynthesis glycosyltransferase
MLVGVKPLEPDTATEVSEPWQQKRYEYSTGFTGLWYTQTVPDGSLDEILVADAYYVATRTWRDDLKLLLHTPIVWYKRCAGRKRN